MSDNDEVNDMLWPDFVFIVAVKILKKIIKIKKQTLNNSESMNWSDFHDLSADPCTWIYCVHMPLPWHISDR